MVSNKFFVAVMVIVLITPFYGFVAQAAEFNVNCSSVDDCMAKGNQLLKKRKLSLALEAYRSAIKKDVENVDAWRKFEKTVVRISEEGGC